MKYRHLKKMNKEDTFKTSIKVVKFSPHSDECNICVINTSRGRKRKRQGVKKCDILPISSNQDHEFLQETLHDEQNMEACNSDGSFSMISTQCSEEANETCISQSDQESPGQNDRKVETDTLIDYFKTLDLDERKNFLHKLIRQLSSEEIGELMFSVGKDQEKFLKQDIENISQQYTDQNFLKEFHADSWLSHRNIPLTRFIEGFTNFSIELSSESLKIALCRIIEQVYALRFQKLVAPISFLISLNIYSKTSSRVAVDILSKTSPSGTYTTLQKWISKSGTNVPSCPPGTIMAAFDNEQVVAYKRGIAPNQKAKSSVITTLIYAAINQVDIPPTSIQQLDDLKPKNWFHLSHFDEKLKFIKTIDTMEGKQLVEKVLSEKVIFITGVKEIRDQNTQEYEDLEKVHFEQLHHFIKQAIETVIEEHTVNETPFFDNVDKSTHEEERGKDILICTLCGTENAKRKLVCEGCQKREGIKEARTKKTDIQNNRLSKNAIPVSKTQEIPLTDEITESSYTRYEHIQSNHESATSVTVGMPAFLNPNSNESVSLVMRHIGISCGIKRYGGNERSWAFVCCDGRPHSLYHKILDESVFCNYCQQSFLSRKEYKDHHKLLHQNLTPSCSREFDWVYMRIGAGHYEMNALKAFFELNWIPYLEKMCELMGFNSENAKHFAKTCKDHHLAWQLLLTFHTASLKEMVIPYVKSLEGTKEEPTVENYFKFYKQFLAHNVNHAYMHLQVCRFSQALINFRMGIRRNNAQLVQSAKFHLKELFYGRCHPHYQNIEIFDSVQYKFMPEAVKTAWDNNVSFSISGDKSKGQDLDFILEEKNKAIKQYLPSGSLPSDETWKSICCNLKFFEFLQEKLSDLLGLGHQLEYGTKMIDISNAVTCFRPVLRKHLSAMHDDHQSISGRKLHHSLVQFLETSTRKRREKIDSNILGTSIEKSSEPVFITEEEEQSYQKKMTKTELKNKIKKLIEKLSENVELQTHYLSVTESLNDTTTNKDTYLTLYFELKDVTANIMDSQINL